MIHRKQELFKVEIDWSGALLMWKSRLLLSSSCPLRSILYVDNRVISIYKVQMIRRRMMKDENFLSTMEIDCVEKGKCKAIQRWLCNLKLEYEHTFDFCGFMGYWLVLLWILAVKLVIFNDWWFLVVFLEFLHHFSSINELSSPIAVIDLLRVM